MRISCRFPRSLPALAAAGLVSLLIASEVLAKSFSWPTYAKKTDDWYRSAEGTRAAENVLSNQTDAGDWPKNIDTSEKPFTGDRAKLAGTFDNGATTGELRFLARAFRATGQTRYREAFTRGLDHLLAAQYPTGGWPQHSPTGTQYHRHITFNDNTMLNILEFLRDVGGRSEEFAFVDSGRRSASARAFDAGIACIVKCQVAVDGKLTVWCAQHDERTLEPRPARKFELVSLSGSESAGILMLLMSLDNPSPEVRRAVHAGARWFEANKLTGIRQEMKNGDRVIVADPAAPPLWARFYQIGTNRPFFCGRDGVMKFDIAEIEPERRNGYAWYGTWGNKVANAYAKWQKTWKD